MTIRILHGDCREVLPTLEADSFDACVTDPPYGLSFMGKGWDHAVPGVDYWAEVYRALKPGAYLLAFGGTRTYHRLVCAIEDAGFEVRDMVAWLYGSGFPKGTDKAKIPEAWKGWNTALKPAIEPICLARKPMVGTLAENLQRYGTGALWVDGCRIGDCVETWPATRARPENARDFHHDYTGSQTRTVSAGDAPPGRWPANVVHDGSEEVLAAFPDTTSAGHASARDGGKGNLFKAGNGTGGLGVRQGMAERHFDTGSAARFFYCAKADRADRNEGLHGMPERVVSVWGGDEDDLTDGKKSTKPRGNHHPTVKPTDLMRYLCRLVTPTGGRVLDPFLGSGSTLKAAELEGFAGTGIELSPEYVEIARRRIAGDAPLFAEVAA